MLNYHFIAVTNLVLILFALIAGWRKFKFGDRAEKIFCLLLAIIFVEEGMAYYAAVRWNDNIPILRCYSLVESFMLALYFNYSIPAFLKRNIGVYIGVFTFTVGLIDWLFFSTNPKELSPFFIFTSGTVIISMAMFSLFQQAVNQHHLPFARSSNFWIAVSLILFWCVVILNLAFYKVLAEAIPQYTMWSNYLFTAVNFGQYLIIGFAFILYPKTKTYV